MDSTEHPLNQSASDHDPEPRPSASHDPRAETEETGGSDESSTAVVDDETKAPPKPKERPREKPAPPSRKVEKMPPWRVLLHNDDINDMGYVVETLLRLTPLTFESAYRCMLEAHLRGLALVLVTHQERAELYRDQFNSKLLMVTIEPDGSE